MPNYRKRLLNRRFRDYFAIHIPVKKGQLDKTDLTLLEKKYGEYLLNEHFMVINFTIKIFETLEKAIFKNSEVNLCSLKNFYDNVFLKNLIFCNYDNKCKPSENFDKIVDIFREMKDIFSGILRNFTNNFIYKLSTEEMNRSKQYNGPLCLFDDFLFKILEGVKDLSFMPNCPIYLLVDDADNLTISQTKILNTWVYQRTTNIVSFKISTQLNYKTYTTVNKSRIETPHDYSEINISDIYTSSKGLYLRRIEKAVTLRLVKYGYDRILPRAFFPQDKEQERQVEEIFSRYEDENGYDFAYRYARPDFMKNLKGNLNTYNYAGFESLVNISSGNMRHFIDFAHKMYTHQKSKTEKVDFIEDGIQNDEIKKYSNWFFDENFTNLIDDESNSEEEKNDFEKLKNLVTALGESFHFILFSDATERRVFSFALQDIPGKDLKRILKLGVQHGYFQKSLISNKNGSGKADLYILNRILSPRFKLDPSGFSGYKFVQCDVLEQALINPNKIIGKIKRISKNKKASDLDEFFDSSQPSLFSEADYEA